MHLAFFVKNVFRSTTNSPLRWYEIFKNSYSTKFSIETDWLTDLLTDCLMPSDKRNSIMAIATVLIFCQSMLLHLKMCLLPTVAALMFATRASLCSPLNSNPFSTTVYRCRWQFVVCALWVQCETWVSAEPAGAFLTLFFCYLKCFK